MYCTSCGKKIKDTDFFCMACGAPTFVSGNNQPMQNTYPQPPGLTPQWMPYGGQAQATGFLKGWLWFIAVCNIIVAIYYFVLLIQSLGGGYVWYYFCLLLACVMIESVVVVGAFRFMKGYKYGFYMICGCAAVTMILNLSMGSYSEVFGNILPPLILWLIAKDQMKYFR